MFSFGSAAPSLVDQVSVTFYNILHVIKSGPVGIVHACINGTSSTLIYGRTGYPVILMIPFILNGVLMYRRNTALQASGTNRTFPGIFFQAIFCFFLCCYPGSCVSELVFQNITPLCLTNANVLLVFTALFVSTHFSPFVMRVCDSPVAQALIQFGFSVDLARASMLTLERTWATSSAAAVWSSVLFFCAGPLLRQIATSAPIAHLNTLPSKSFAIHLLLLMSYYVVHRYFYHCTASLNECGTQNPQCFVNFAFVPAVFALGEVIWSKVRSKLEGQLKKKK